MKCQGEGQREVDRETCPGGSSDCMATPPSPWGFGEVATLRIGQEIATSRGRPEGDPAESLQHHPASDLEETMSQQVSWTQWYPTRPFLGCFLEGEGLYLALG